MSALIIGAPLIVPTTAPCCVLDGPVLAIVVIAPISPPVAARVERWRVRRLQDARQRARAEAAGRPG